jgi:cytochrome bd-type quinol oxidase subunit 1
MGGLITVTFIVFYKAIVPRFKNYFDLRKGKTRFKVFKFSVIVMSIHFVLSLVSGLLMNFGLNTFQFHATSRYIVPFIVLLHLTTNLYSKVKNRR